MAYLDNTGLAYFWGKIKAYVAALLAPKADDADVVHKAGEETVSGVKTVTGQFQRSSSIVGTMFRHPEAVRGTTPSNNKEWIIPFCDASGAEWGANGSHGRLGSVSAMVFSAGQLATAKTSLISYANIAGSTLAAGLDVGFAGENGDIPWAQAPSTRADRTAGKDIVTRDWIPQDTRIVHTTDDEIITGVKTLDGFASYFRRRCPLDRNESVSQVTAVYCLRLLGHHSLGVHELSAYFFERYQTPLLGVTLNSNRSVIRVVGATGKVADLNVRMTDSDTAVVDVAVSGGVSFAGYLGNTRINIAENNVADADVAMMYETTRNYRCGVVRFGNYTNYNTAMIGACDKSNTAPRGMTITNTNNVCSASFVAHVIPDASNTYTLGTSSLRWSQLYISASAVSTSDERVKSFISEVPDEVLDAWESVGFIRFKFNDSIAEKGADRARYHSGLVAQRIAEAFSSAGLDASAYGLFCYDEWDAEPEVLDQNGEPVQRGYDAGNLYSVRYEEALCMEAAWQRRENARLKKRIADLEERLAALELKIS